MKERGSFLLRLLYNEKKKNDHHHHMSTSTTSSSSNMTRRRRGWNEKFVIIVTLVIIVTVVTIVNLDEVRFFSSYYVSIAKTDIEDNGTQHNGATGTKKSVPTPLTSSSSTTSSSSSIQRLILQSMLHNMTSLESIEVYLTNQTNYHHVYYSDDGFDTVDGSKKTNGKVKENPTGILVPGNHPDPFPSYMIEYALHNFSTSTNTTTASSTSGNKNTNNDTLVSEQQKPQQQDQEVSIITNPWVDPTCKVTSQIELIQGWFSSSPNSNGSEEKKKNWIIRTYDIDGIRKTIGGDEFTVYYIDKNDMSATTSDKGSSKNKTTAVARVMDMEDGTYELEFHRTPTTITNSRSGRLQLVEPASDSMSGEGTLVIVLVFSCNVGMIAPPGKETWNTGGMIMSFYHIHNITMPTSKSFIKPFIPANTNHEIDFSTYDYVLVHGDSTMVHFFEGNYKNNAKNSNMLMWTGDNRYPLYVENVKKVMEQVFGHMSWMNRDAKNNKTAFVYGSSAWDINIDPQGIHGPTFQYEIDACEQLVRTFHAKFPTVDVYWRSGLAMHPSLSTYNTKLITSRQKRWYLDDRNMYMSNGRVQLLHSLQKELITKKLRSTSLSSPSVVQQPNDGTISSSSANSTLRTTPPIHVTWLELYEPTYYAMDYHETKRVKGDAVHYTHSFNQIMTGWFYDPSSTKHPHRQLRAD